MIMRLDKQRPDRTRPARAPRRRRGRASRGSAGVDYLPTPPTATGESDMSVIPFNVPGLPEPDELSSRFVFKPISIDSSDSKAGARVAHRPGARAGATSDPSTDGVLCIYPDIETVAYLFNASLQTGRHAPVPALVVSSQSTDGLSTIFGFGQVDGLPQLTVDILPEASLPAPIGPGGEPAPIDVSRIDERLELTQIFATNTLGVVSRVENNLMHAPKPGTPRRGGEPVFTFYDDATTIADVCSFYFTRGLALVGDNYGGRAVGTNMMAGPDSIWQLLWKPTPMRCILAFAVVYVLTRTSLRVRRVRGQTDFELDYNRRANRPDSNPSND